MGYRCMRRGLKQTLKTPVVSLGDKIRIPPSATISTSQEANDRVLTLTLGPFRPSTWAVQWFNVGQGGNYAVGGDGGKNMRKYAGKCGGNADRIIPPPVLGRDRSRALCRRGDRGRQPGSSPAPAAKHRPTGGVRNQTVAESGNPIGVTAQSRTLVNPLGITRQREGKIIYLNLIRGAGWGSGQGGRRRVIKKTHKSMCNLGPKRKWVGGTRALARQRRRLEPDLTAQRGVSSQLQTRLQPNLSTCGQKKIFDP